ncbi:hypothetical protein [Actinoplanes sp. CA-252034]|uniref:hypothetical protein n=1 Tax=Actinoplanes sp. CA-252034 TaxID=3239906 RepID=UPI003D992A13
MLDGALNRTCEGWSEKVPQMTVNRVADSAIGAGRPKSSAPYVRQDSCTAPGIDGGGGSGIAELVTQVLRWQQDISVLAGNIAVAENQLALAYRRVGRA